MKVEVTYDVVVSAGSNSDAPTCAYPLSAVAEDGSIVSMYRRGKEKHSYDGILVSQRSVDLGRSWSGPVILFDGRTLDPPHSPGSGGLCRCGDGSLLAGFCVTEVTKPETYVFSEEGFTQRTFHATARSLDHGKTWQTPQYVDDAVLVSPWGPTSNPLLLADGTLFLPGERLYGEGHLGICTTYSSNHGHTLEPIADLLIDPTGQLNYADARFTMFEDGEVMAMLWTFRQSDEQTVQVHRSSSRDWGRTWSEPQPVGHMGQITDPLAIGGDVVLAASNYRWPPDGIRLWISKDRGRTWPVDQSIQMWDSQQERIVAKFMPLSDHSNNDGVWNALPSFTFGTPNLKRLPDGSFLLTYYAQIGDKTDVRACRFRVDDCQLDQ